MECNISHAKLFGLVAEINRNFRMPKVNACNVESINKHLADQREQLMRDDEETIKKDDIELDISNERKDEVHNRPRKHERMLSGALGNINVTEIRIGVVLYGSSFKSMPFMVGPKTRELEHVEIDKQLAAVIIKPAQSEGAALLLFV